MTLALVLILSLARAQALTPRLDVLCGAYLSHGADAGRALTGVEFERELGAPLGLVADSIRALDHGPGFGARFRNIFRAAADASSEHFSFREEDLGAVDSALGRRDAAWTIDYRLRAMADDARLTPPRASPLSHVLRGRDEVLKFLKSVRATAVEVQADLMERNAARVAALHAEKTRLGERGPRALSRAQKIAVMSAYGALVTGASLLLGPHAPHVTPAFAVLFGAGGWVLRGHAYDAFRSVGWRWRRFTAGRRLDRALDDVDRREAAAGRAHFELDAIDEMIEMVAAVAPMTPPTSRYAFYTHTVDLPIPLAAAYHEDRPLAADVVIGAVLDGHVPFTGGRRARLTHALHFENGVPVLLTLLQEELQPGIADLYGADDP